MLYVSVEQKVYDKQIPAAWAALYYTDNITYKSAV